MKSAHAKKILANVSDLDRWLSQIKRPLVFTNGCFDLLHRGHISYLEAAAQLGESLIVALNSDDSVRRLNKGPARPLNALEDRMAVMASLQCVDAVCCFDTDTPLELITQIKPDHLVKGGDWPVENIIGYAFVAAQGGQTHSIPFKHATSTTQLVNKILSTG